MVKHFPFMKSILPLALLIFGGTALADIDRTQKPAPGPAPAASFPDYHTSTLPNGLKIFVIEDDRKPTVTFRLVIKSGSVFDQGKTGLTGLVTELLERGTTARSAAAFAQEIDFIGMKLESSAGPDS